MLTGKELILATKPFAKEIRWKSWYHTITALLLLVGAVFGTFDIAYTYFGVATGPALLFRIACSIFAAMMLSRFFIIFHDFQHHTILRKSFVADMIFTAFSVYMITPPNIWKRSHDHHHNHNAKLFSASIGSYPIMTKQKFLEATKKERFEYLAIRSPINMFFAYFTTFMFGLCIQSFLSSPRRHWDSIVVLALHIAIAVTIFIHFGPLTWFLAFFLPFFLSQMLGAYLFYAQHNFPGAKFKNNTEWSYTEAALESSSYMKLDPFFQWVTANIGFHHIHHLNSKIPFYRLPEAMAALPELQQARKTTLRPGDIVRCLRLKVWDAERDEMVGYREMDAA